MSAQRALRPQPVGLCAQGQPGDGGGGLPDDLRPGHPRRDDFTVGSRARHVRRALRQGRVAHGHRQRRGACVQRLPPRPLASDLVDEPVGAEAQVQGGRIFPTENALIRLAGAVLLDTHEEWLATDRRYFSEASMAKLYAERDDGDAEVDELERVTS